MTTASEIHELEKALAVKAAECQRHQERTEILDKTLHHTECGLVVKMAKMETQLSTLQALSYATLSATVLVLLSLVGYFYHESQQRAAPAPRTTEISRSAVDLAE